MTKPRIAFTAVISSEGEYRLGLAEKNIAGYSPVGGPYPSFEAASASANRYNAELGLDTKTAFLIVTSSMWLMSESGSCRAREELEVIATARHTATLLSWRLV